MLSEESVRRGYFERKRRENALMIEQQRQRESQIEAQQRIFEGQWEIEFLGCSYCGMLLTKERINKHGECRGCGYLV